MAAAEPAAPSGRGAVLAAWKTGGPNVRRAAEAALTGSDQDAATFLSSGLGVAAEQDLRVRVEQMIATSGSEVRRAATVALAGSAASVQAFVSTGWQKPFEDDQRIRATQISSVSGTEVKLAGGKALRGSLADVTAFLDVGQFKAREDDDRIQVTNLASVGGPEVKTGAGRALAGTIGDVQEFLRTGWQVASARDAETSTVAQLAELAHNASAQANDKMQAAKEAAGRAESAAKVAKEAAELAAKETKAAQNSGVQASNAAGRAADAASRAAAAAQTVSVAAAAANEAARLAANAAAQAATASTQAGDAAARASSAAAAAATDKGKADAAWTAAADARKAAAHSKEAGEAAAWAGRIATEIGVIAQASVSAANNAALAAKASADAAVASGVSGEAADRARQAAATAATAAAEATRAANATTAIAAEAATAAGEAQRAANDAADHAIHAAEAAETAARAAGSATTAAADATAAATAASAAADIAENAAKQAHNIAAISTKADAERLASQTAQAVSAAKAAAVVEANDKKTAAWQAGQNIMLADDTRRLLTDAATAGVEPAVAVTKTRQAAVRLLTAGGPWTKAAAETALSGTDADALDFLRTRLDVARDRDGRISIAAIAEQASTMEQRLAAETAQVGAADQVRQFLTTGDYPGKGSDDRLLATQISSISGPLVKEAGGTALRGTDADVAAFLTTGQYAARDKDNLLLITQAASVGGAEVKAAAQAAVTGPTSGLAPFLQTGLPKAQQRDADAASHNALIGSYLAQIDGYAAVARQYAWNAAESAARANHFADTANGYSTNASASATKAKDFATAAAASALAAQNSANQAAASAKQAQANAAAANSDAQKAADSATAATISAKKAKEYADAAATSAAQAQASALAAGQTKAQADQAYLTADLNAWKLQQRENAVGSLEANTTFIDRDGRVNTIRAVSIGNDFKLDIKPDDKRCMTGAGEAWHKNPNGTNDKVCDFPWSGTISSTVVYYLQTCPVPNLAAADCLGKYTPADIVHITTDKIVNKPISGTDSMTEWEYSDNFKVYCKEGAGCGTVVSRMMLSRMIFGDIIECIKNPGLNGACFAAVAMLIPYGTLLKAVEAVVVIRYAIVTGAALNESQLALRGVLAGLTEPVLARLDAAAEAIARFRVSLRDGVDLKAAFAALRSNAAVDAQTVNALERKLLSDTGAVRVCNNSFSSDTPVLMADGSHRPISTVVVGDRVWATDPDTGLSESKPVTQLHLNVDTALTDVTIATSNDQETVVKTTPEHPFWDSTRARWVGASQLSAHDSLRTPDGKTAVVIRVRNYGDIVPMHNLTVADIHTYYVVAGGTPVLVHNDSPCLSFARKYDDGGIVISDLRDGVMTMAVEKAQESATVNGGQMFRDAMEFFGSANVRAFDAKWVPAMPTNLDAFNANLRAGMSYEEAARNTFTGYMAGKYGLVKITVDTSKLKGEFGYYTNAEPFFSR